MDRRQKDLRTMAEHAELAVVSFDRKGGRLYAIMVAENGVQRTFSISIGSRSDPRGDLNELGAMKRFARENRLQTDAPGTNPHMPAAPAASPQSNDRKTRPMTATTKKSTLTMAAVQAAAAPSLTAVNFYRVCEWLKTQNLTTVPSLEGLAMLAGQWLGQAVPEDEMKLVLDTIGTKEPAHWSEPTEPNAIVARELLHIMKKLGEEPSPAFKRLTASLLPA